MAISNLENQRSGETDAIVIIKAAPQVGQRHGETVCCAGIDLQGNWLRLYPISFRTLKPDQKFGRWDRIRFQWRRPIDDNRVESRRVDQDTIKIVSTLKASEKQDFLGPKIVTSLANERAQGRSLALLKAEILDFLIEPRTDEEIEKENRKFELRRAQSDLFIAPDVIPHNACPYRFKYQYQTDDGFREGTCQDWEIETTFFKWSSLYGASRALEEMQRVFGEEYPKRGMLLAMGTHSLHPDTWLINGVVRLDEIEQLSLSF